MSNVNNLWRGEYDYLPAYMVGFYCDGEDTELNKYDLPAGMWEDAIADVTRLNDVVGWMPLPEFNNG